MYGNFFEMLRKIRKDSGCTAAEIPLDVPEAYYVHLDDQDPSGTTVSLEDLKSQGYTTANKNTGLDVDHIKRVLASLAHYHALTIAFLRKHSTSDGHQLPASAEFLNESAAFEKLSRNCAEPWNKANKDLMRLCDREDVRFLVPLLFTTRPVTVLLFLERCLACQIRYETTELLDSTKTRQT